MIPFPGGLWSNTESSADFGFAKKPFLACRAPSAGMIVTGSVCVARCSTWESPLCWMVVLSNLSTCACACSDGSDGVDLRLISSVNRLIVASSSSGMTVLDTDMTKSIAMRFGSTHDTCKVDCRHTQLNSNRENLTSNRVKMNCLIVVKIYASARRRERGQGWGRRRMEDEKRKDKDKLPQISRW